VAAKRTVITIETHRLTVVGSRRSSVVAWCERCGGQVRMVTPEQAATLAGTKPRDIYRRVESDDLHFVGSGTGTMLICAGSL
jgi:hypothetical protein